MKKINLVFFLWVSLFVGMISPTQCLADIQKRPFFRIEDDLNPIPNLWPGKCLKHFTEVTRLYRYVRGETEPRRLADQSGVKKYLLAFYRVYEKLPAPLQKMFCYLSEVRIADGERNSTANMLPWYDKQGRFNRAGVEFDRTMLDNRMSLKKWATWKEQLSFGGVRHLNATLPWLPLVNTNIDNQTDGFIYYLIAHEFGHILDFSNEINSFQNGHASSLWSQLSWSTEKTRKKSSTFPFVQDFCFYNCKEGAHIPYSKIGVAYRGLWHSDFISAYATTDFLDDWAETVAFWALNYLKGTTYSVDFPEGDDFYTCNLIEKFNSESFKAKRNFVNDFFAGEIKYPKVLP